MPKQSDDLSREGEPSQETEKGLEIPVPKRRAFLDNLRKSAKRPKSEKPPKT